MLNRIKFEIDPLVSDILDQLPESVWTSKKTTFLDPALGGGQFVRAIERRLRAYGHKKLNIRKRVFGFEVSNLHIHFAVNKYNLLGQYALKTYDQFLKMDHDMKFDVIVGNPPYQDGTLDGGQNKIYNQFSKKALELLSDDGVMAFVTPTSILKMSKRFSLVNMDGLKIVDFRANNYFTVGINICWWMVDRNYSGDVTVYNNTGVTTQPNTNVIYDYSIVDKDFATLYEALKRATDTPSKRMFKQNNFGDASRKVRSKDFTYKLHKIEDNKIKITYWSSRVPYCHSQNKISIGMTKMLTNDACYVGKENFDSGYMIIDVKDETEVENIKSFILSDYFIEHSNKWKKLDGYGYNYALKYLPPFDTSKKWSSAKVKAFLESYVKSNN